MHTEKFNYKLTDWEEFRRTVVEIQETENFTSVGVCLDQINNLDTAIKSAIKEHILVTKLSTYAKRWWMKELENLKETKND